MFTLAWEVTASEQYDQLKKKAEAVARKRAVEDKKKKSSVEGLFNQVFKTLDLIRRNPKHPGLQTHEFTALENPVDPKGKVFESYAQNNTPGAYRIFWCYGPAKQQITIIAITPHP